MPAIKGHLDPLLVLQEGLTRTDLAHVLEALWEVLHCPMILHFSDSGVVAGMEIKPEDFSPDRRGSANHDNPWQEAMEMIRPPLARFSDYVSEKDLVNSGLYHDWLRLRHWLHGAMVASLEQKDPLAWITFYREADEPDFNQEEMNYLSLFQAHFDAAVHRILRAEHRWGLENILRATAARYGLSERELEILGTLLEGKTNAEIAEQMFISPGTVKVHIEHILNKTGARSRTELVSIVLKHLPR